MVKTSLTVLVAFCLWGASPAMAHVHRGWHHHHNHWRNHHWRNAYHHGPYTIGYGDTIVSGKTGLHRSLLGQMVPDANAVAGDDFILTGRARGSGLGANGLPGINLQ